MVLSRLPAPSSAIPILVRHAVLVARRPGAGETMRRHLLIPLSAWGQRCRHADGAVGMRTALSVCGRRCPQADRLSR
jgi:hypothetical protein